MATEVFTDGMPGAETRKKLNEFIVEMRSVVMPSESGTSLTVGNGTKVLTVPEGRAYGLGQGVNIARTSDPTIWMAGTVTDYTGTQLTVEVSSHQGSGTYSDWTITLSGAVGPQGDPAEFQTSATHIQWRIAGSGTAWQDLVALDDLEGPTGPANQLGIGSVTKDVTADASITGSYPNQVLNLVLPKGDAGDSVEMKKSATHIQWRLVGASTWIDLVPLTDIKGNQGDAGKEVELQKTATHIQWRLTGGSWANLVLLTDLKGDTGDGGWSSVTAVVADGARFVLEITDWTGGDGTKPATGYIGPSGIVATKAAAVDIRGPAGTGDVNSVNSVLPDGSGNVTLGTADIPTLDETLADKVDKVSGKGLSANDYTTTDKNKLDGIAESATANDTDAQLRDRSTHTGFQGMNTITGLTDAIADAIAAAGEDGKDGSLGIYRPDMYIEDPSQIFWRDGELYRADASLALPYTTTGDWESEESLFVPVGDASLRQELDGDVATGQGARLVRGAVIYVDTIADLQALDTSGLVDGQQFCFGSFWSGADIGGGVFRWDATRSKTEHNGGTIRDPGKASEIDDVNRTFGSWFTSAGSGQGVLVKVDRLGAIYPADFGAFCDGTHDDGPSIRAAAGELNAVGGYIDLEGLEYELNSSGFTLSSERSSIVMGQGATINVNTLEGDVITIYSGIGGPQIKNPMVSSVNFVSSTTRTSGTTITMLNTSDPIIENCNFRGQWRGIKTATFQYGVVHSCSWNVVGLECIEVAQGSGFTISDCRAIAGPDKVPTAKGIRLTHASGVMVSNCDLVRFGHGVFGAPGAGSTCQFLFFNNVLCDSGVHGFFFTTSNGGSLSSIHGVNCWGSSNDENNVYAAGVQGISFTGGGRFILAAKDGLQFISCMDVTVSDNFIAWNNRSNATDGSGVLFNGCTRTILDNNTVTNSVEYPDYASTRNQNRAVTYIHANVSPTCTNNKFSGHPKPDIYRATNIGNPGPCTGNSTDRSNEVAAATNITTELAHDIVKITGTGVTIENILTESWEGKEQKFLISDGVNINSGNNFKLSGNFVAVSNPGSTLSLISFLGFGWCETARSIN